MTRETKLGLIVAGSFLVLVSAVMSVKAIFHPVVPTADGDGKVVAEAPAPISPSAAPEPKPAKPVEKPRAPIVSNGDEEPITPRNPQPARKENDPFRSAAPKSMTDMHITPVGREEVPMVSLEEIPITTAPAAPVKKDVPLILDEIPTSNLKEVPTAKVKEFEIKKRPKEDIDLIETPRGDKESKEMALPGRRPELAAPADDKKEIALPPLKNESAPDPLKLAQLPVDAPPANTPPKKQPDPATLDLLEPPPESKENHKLPDLPQIKPVPPLETPALDVPGAITLQPAPKKSEGRDAITPEPAKIELNLPKKLEVPEHVAPQPKIEFTTPKKADVPALEIKPSEPKTADPAPAVAAKPTEDNYEEDLYTMRDGENYLTISKLHYRSETYANALKKYNLANPGGEAKYIRIPPVWILEKRYPNDINNVGQAAHFAPPVAVEVARPQQNVYVVPAQGEFLAEIAQKTLGNEDAWTRIKELNKTINEVKRIPAGTRLVLPPEARAPGN